MATCLNNVSTFFIVMGIFYIIAGSLQLMFRAGPPPNPIAMFFLFFFGGFTTKIGLMGIGFILVGGLLQLVVFLFR